MIVFVRFTAIVSDSVNNSNQSIDCHVEALNPFVPARKTTAAAVKP